MSAVSKSRLAAAAILAAGVAAARHLLLVWGEKHRSSLNKSRIRLARLIFHCSTAVPFVLYHLRTSESRPLFPHTISWAIRKGWPRIAQHALWLLGWATFFSALRRTGRSVKIFAAQMVATGIVATMVCPVGRGPVSDKVHFVASGESRAQRESKLQ